ncbi:MAG: DUF2695 domain-containing protein [Candidatus Nanopelagicales bacterium]
MSDLSTILEAELTALSDGLTQVRPAECLYCYLTRMLDEFGCHGHQFTERWHAAQPSRLPWLSDWLSRNGGCCCDCEVIWNVFLPGVRSPRHAMLQCQASFDLAAQEQMD